MRLDSLLLTGTLLFSGACATGTAAVRPATSEVETAKRKNARAQSLVDKTVEAFREINKDFEPSERRNYEEIIGSASKSGYRVLNIGLSGEGLSVVLIGWRHASLEEKRNTSDVNQGLDIVLNTFERGDIVMPESLPSGEVERALIYEPWAEMTEFITSQKGYRGFSGFLCLNLESPEVGKSPVIFVGSDKPKTAQEFAELRKVRELYLLWATALEEKAKGNDKRGFELFSKYFNKSWKYFPNLTDDERTNFGKVFDRYDSYLRGEESDERELDYLLPTITGLNKTKHPTQLIFVTRGQAHLKRRKLLDGLRERRIGYVALIPE